MKIMPKFLLFLFVSITSGYAAADSTSFSTNYMVPTEEDSLKKKLNTLYTAKNNCKKSELLRKAEISYNISVTETELSMINWRNSKLTSLN